MTALSVLGLCLEPFGQQLHAHRTDPPNTGIYRLVQSLGIHLPLREEKVDFVIIPVVVVRNNC